MRCINLPNSSQRSVSTHAFVVQHKIKCVAKSGNCHPSSTSSPSSCGTKETQVSYYVTTSPYHPLLRKTSMCADERSPCHANGLCPPIQLRRQRNTSTMLQLAHTTQLWCKRSTSALLKLAYAVSTGHGRPSSCCAKHETGHILSMLFWTVTLCGLVGTHQHFG